MSVRLCGASHPLHTVAWSQASSLFSFAPCSCFSSEASFFSTSPFCLQSMGISNNHCGRIRQSWSHFQPHYFSCIIPSSLSHTHDSRLTEWKIYAKDGQSSLPNTHANANVNKAVGVLVGLHPKNHSDDGFIWQAGQMNTSSGREHRPDIMLEMVKAGRGGDTQLPSRTPWDPIAFT